MSDITTSIDGNLWFTEGDRNRIGRITPSGVITEFPVPSPNSEPIGITSDAAGNLWFTEFAANQIGRLDASGNFTEIAVPTGNSGPIAICLGPDGNLWFSEYYGSQIGRLDSSGQITEFAVPSGHPNEIGPGPDGNVWFTESFSSNIGLITPAGAVTEFQVPTRAGLQSLTIGPDNQLWFADEDGFIVHRNADGSFTRFTTPAPNGVPVDITAGSDGNLWFTEYNGDKIGQMTPAGSFTEYATPTTGSHPYFLTTGPDQNIWFTENGTNQIGQLRLDRFLSIADASVTEGNAGTTNMTFTVTLTPPSSQTVTVHYATAAGTAKAGFDFVNKSGNLTFNPGETTKTITVQVKGDLLNEDNENFFVNLSSPTNALLGDSQAVGTILDDDPMPSLAVNDISVIEGNSGTTNATFTITLSTASGRSVSVQYATANGTAEAPGDFTFKTGSVTFSAGQTSKLVTIAVRGDTTVEPDENFFLNLVTSTNATIADSQGTCTILNDDGAARSSANVNSTDSNLAHETAVDHVIQTVFPVQQSALGTSEGFPSAAASASPVAEGGIGHPRQLPHFLIPDAVPAAARAAQCPWARASEDYFRALPLQHPADGSWPTAW